MEINQTPEYSAKNDPAWAPLRGPGSPPNVRFIAGGDKLCLRTGQEVLSNHGTCIIGMSPGNTHFSEANIENLLVSAAAQFEKLVVFIPSASAQHTFAALGYSETEAASKARLKGNNLFNRCMRVAAKYPSVQEKLEFVNWGKDVVPSSEYKVCLTALKNLFETNSDFQEMARDAARGVLIARTEQQEITQQDLDRAAQYVLEELAYLEVAPRLLGTDRVAYVYHREWPIFESFVEGFFDNKPRNNLGFILASDGGK